MRHKGFTLIELLVTMGIIAVLTGLAVFNFSQSRVRARDLQRKSDLSQLQKAMEVYKNDKSKYPSDTLAVAQTELMATTQYIKAEFHDPQASEWEDYQYKQIDNKSYYLYACLENSADSARTVDTSTCTIFTGTGTCSCGTDGKGAVYIITEP